ncbi:tetratricopeptide repeat-containing protein [Sphingomonas sp. FW199]|uniref:tetratricopeptide repeat-containing protein n=1 Tax=Sphingomonas sp. FW199 TaxID=3400217 RepID=UPI003CF779D8
MTEDSRAICFVVMGFGKKTDFESGRTIDLDATYEAIIEPAAAKHNLRCIRADEITHSGIIDTPMYEMLLRSDLVIADISTGNVNAVYELGVRHALRPNCTIIMKEREGRLYFDLNHVNTFEYDHLGEDIGAREAQRASRDLGILIEEVMASGRTDSPVYTYLPRLMQPRLSEEEFSDLVDETEAAQERLSELMQRGEAAMKASDPEGAVQAFQAAAHLKGPDPFIIQQLGLATYKTKKPSPLEALIAGLRIMDQLSPDASNDPETLGITGAIRKRLWHLTSDRAQLDAAIRYYGRGFEVRRDYYNGENLALCYEFRQALQADPDEALYDRLSARKVRTVLFETLSLLIETPSFDERSDRRWVLATLANCAYSLGKQHEGDQFEGRFMGEQPALWEIETYQESKAHILGAFPPDVAVADIPSPGEL